MSYNPGKVSVTGSVTTTVSANTPPRITGTPVCAVANAMATGSTIHTVTAGKTFYLTAVLITGPAVLANLSVDGTEIISWYSFAGVNSLIFLTAPIPVAATKNIVINHAGGSSNGCILGWEE